MVFRIVRSPVFPAFVIGLLFCFPAIGQQKDAGLWTSVNFEAKVVKKLTATISEEVRFNENITEVGAIFTDVGVEYKLNKHFQVALDYRYIKKRLVDDFYITRPRIKSSKKMKKKKKTI